MADLPICDKCGAPVEPSNDACLLMYELTGEQRFLEPGETRHLLPVGQFDMPGYCPGSPSRAQYLLGQPRDERGYPYRQSNEAPMREAYVRLVRKYKK